MVEERVRNCLLPQSVVSVTGLPYTPEIENMEKKGALKRFPLFSEITKNGVKWEDRTEKSADVILWNTGFRWPMAHLDLAFPREESGGIKMSERLATEVAKEPRIHLVGYGPSASTIGANRAGAAARELVKLLES